MSSTITMNSEMKRFNHLTTEIDAAYHEAALKFGLSDSAMLILYTICSNGKECLLNDITRLSGISKQTVNSALRKLESNGIVQLEVYGGRMKKICLTDKGIRLTNDTVLNIIKAENEIFASWTNKERELYLELTQRYLDAFRNKVKEF